MAQVALPRFGSGKSIIRFTRTSNPCANVAVRFMNRRRQLEQPVVALINNSQTPYRQALHARVIREIPEVFFYSVFTHEVSNAAWEYRRTPEINPVEFGQGEDSLNATNIMSILAEWRKGGRIIQWIRDNRIRAVVLGGYNDAGRLRLINYCRRRKIPCFLFGDSNIKGDSTNWIKGFLKRSLLTRIIRSCAGVMPCGELGRQFFLKYGADPRRVFLFPYEPDYELIRSIEPETAKGMCARFGLKGSRRRVVFSGRLVDVKRADLVIDAFVSIASVRSEWDLVIIGDGPLKATLKSRVPFDFANRVKWLGFLDDQRLLSAIYRFSDVLVLPSDYEPWGVVINEAVTAGMAVLASDQVGAAYELVIDGKNGFTFPAGNLQEMVRRLLSITDVDQLALFKAGSLESLTKWKERADPVEGLRNALTDFDVISRNESR
jgi:glycosyltransferase involved in cell wall biosynthesis